MYKTFIFIVLFSFGFGQENFKSIHQIELNYNKENYLEPLFKPYLGPADPIQARRDDPSKKVFGYHPYWQGTKWQSYNYDLLTTIAYFSAETNSTGDLTNLHGWPATDLINKAHANGVEVVLTVTLFDKSDIETLLSHNSYRDRLIKNLLYEVNRAGADGVNIDFESFPESQKNNLVSFVKNLRKSLRDSIPNAQVTLATPAVDWSNAWDFNALATESDGLFIMGYDYHWKGSTTTGPVAPLTGGSYNITNTVNTYLSVTNNNYEKLILGNPYYGYEWPANSGDKGASTTNVGTAVVFSTAESKALSYGKLWDSDSQTPWYRYQNPSWFQTWYDDSLSLSNKYDFVISKKLGGVGIWALGYDEGYDELWNALNEKMGAKSAPLTPINFNVVNVGKGLASIEFSGSDNATFFEVIRVYSNSNQTESLGQFSSSPILLENLNDNESYFIKLKAINAYGSSKHTEVLGVIPSANSPKVLIVNGFDRVTGTNNTFDFIKEHGSALHNNDYLFDSASNEAIINKYIKLTDYQIVDWILGEEGTATSSFNDIEQSLIQEFLMDGGKLFVSGSEVGYDLSDKGNTNDKLFYEKFLRANYISDAAGGRQTNYNAYGVQGTLFDGVNLSFDDGTQGSYDVDWPDGIKPISNEEINLKFEGVDYDSSGGAGISYRGGFGGSPLSGGLVYLTIGFESIYPENKRNIIMKRVMHYLDGPFTSIMDENQLVPDKPRITALYPNPSNKSISIEFQIIRQTPIAYLSITDILGRELFNMSVQSLPTKNQKFNWTGTLKNGTEAPSGIYIAKLSQGNQLVTKRFTLLK
jgi:spore germination protein YaaH